MPAEITMPQLSDTMTEGTVVKWHKKVGDSVKSGEEIADVETDKATMPMESFDAGTLAVILVAEGQKVKVGQPIGVVAIGSENIDDVKKKYAAAPPKPETAQKAPSAPPRRHQHRRPLPHPPSLPPQNPLRQNPRIINTTS